MTVSKHISKALSMRYQKRPVYSLDVVQKPLESRPWRKKGNRDLLFRSGDLKIVIEYWMTVEDRLKRDIPPYLLVYQYTTI